MTKKECTLRDRIRSAMISTPIGMAVLHYAFGFEAVTIAIAAIIGCLVSVWPGGKFLYRKLGFNCPT